MPERRFRVVWPDAAALDLLRLTSWVAAESPSSSAALLSRPYRIVYRIAGHTVAVLGVFDGRRELEDVLLERLTAPPES